MTIDTFPFKVLIVKNTRTINMLESNVVNDKGSKINTF